MEDKTRQLRSSKAAEGPFVAYMVIAFASAFGSMGVAFIVFVAARWSNLSDGGLWALSATVFAPAFMGIGISYWVHRTSSARSVVRNTSPLESDPVIQFGIKE